MEATKAGSCYRDVIYNLQIYLEKAMSMKRIYGPAKGRSLATTHNGLIYAVAYDPKSSKDIKAQTQNTLDFLDDVLGQSKSSKHSLIQATIYLSDIKMKADMDEVWCNWIGKKENWPQRACIEADMGEGSLIEVVVIAAEE